MNKIREPSGSASRDIGSQPTSDFAHRLRHGSLRHTHPVLVREVIERHPELERAAREIFFCPGGPCYHVDKIVTDKATPPEMVAELRKLSIE